MSSLSFLGGIGIWLFSKASEGHSIAGPCGWLMFCIVTVKQKFETYLEELAGVLVSIVQSNASSADLMVLTDSEVLRLEGHLGTVLFDNHLSLQESTLGSSRVNNLGFSDHNGPVFEEVVEDELANSEIFKS